MILLGLSMYYVYRTLYNDTTYNNTLAWGWDTVLALHRGTAPPSSEHTHKM